MINEKLNVSAVNVFGKDCTIKHTDSGITIRVPIEKPENVLTPKYNLDVCKAKDFSESWVFVMRTAELKPLHIRILLIDKADPSIVYLEMLDGEIM